MHVLVLAGGLSPERDVSIRSGRRVAEAVRSARSEFTVEESDVDVNLLSRISGDRPDCVVLELHGAAGEDGSIRDVLAALEIPFVGSSAEASRIAFDKPAAATLLNRAGIHTPKSMALPHATFRELGAAGVMDAIVARLGLPLVVKPAKGGSALGASVVRAASELPAAMVGAFAYGEVAYVEQFIDGTEVAISVLDVGEPRALPVVEIVPDGGFYDYQARYTAGSTEFFVPARLPQSHLDSAATTAVQAHEVLGLRDWSRTDAIIDADGVVWVLEVNVAPGMTETSLFPQSLAAAGLEVGDITAALIQRAVTR